DLIDVLDLHALGDQQHRLVEVRRQDAVDDEAGTVLDHDRRFGQRHGPAPQQVDGAAVGVGTADDLDQRQLVDRVEEVTAGDAAAVFQPLRDGGDGQRRGVRGQDGVGAGNAVQLGEDGPLRLQVLDGRLDDEVGGVEAVPGERALDGLELLL